MRITWHRKLLIRATLSLLLFLTLSNNSFATTEFKLLASDGAAEDAFGVSVSISGDVALVGAENDDDKGTDSGSAYVFRWNDSSWVEEQKLLASDGVADDEFGESVSISGDVALVGAEGDDDNGSDSGSAYVFRWNGSSWVEEQKLLAFDGVENDAFGFSVSINGDVALVGTPGIVENIVTGPGKAYVYALDGPAAEIIGTWSSGIWYWDGSRLPADPWTQMTADVGARDIAAGDFNGDGFADVASTWDEFGLWYQNGANLDDWVKIDDMPPMSVTAGDVTGDGRVEIIGTWENGIWYWDGIKLPANRWTQMTPDVGAKDIAAGDFDGDGFADVASTWDEFGLRYQNGANLDDWIQIDESPPSRVTAGDVTGD